MSDGALSALAAAMSAVAALAALVIAGIGIRQAKTASQLTRRQIARATDDSLQSRLDPMYPDLRDLLGHLEDGVPHEVRHVLIPLFVLYSDAFGAHRDGLLDDRDWNGFRQELAYWTQKPTARRAWKVFRRQTWTEGFVDHVDTILAGPSAYPDIEEFDTAAPDVDWPTDSPR